MWRETCRMGDQRRCRGARVAALPRPPQHHASRSRGRSSASGGSSRRIAEAFAKKLGRVVRLRSEVTAIRRTNNGVRISFIDKQAGRHNAIEAAYCIVTIPLKVLQGIECDFSPAYRAAIRDGDYGNAVKIAWQSRRFWEADEHIYGGISWTTSP